MQLTIVKIGGNIIDDEQKLKLFLDNFTTLEGYKILVHGGGKIATGIGEKLGITPDYINGRRITDKQTLDLVTMVYGGLINKNIVALLQALHCNAIGLTGADGGVIPAAKRPVGDIDYGFVGDITGEDIKHRMVMLLLQNGLVPVFAPLTFSPQCGMLNTNADTIAQEIAKAMAHHMNVQLIYCLEKKGVLLDATDDSSVINSMTEADFKELKEQEIISNGMIPKLENAFAAVRAGVKRVIIGHADELCDIISGTAGTIIQ